MVASTPSLVPPAIAAVLFGDRLSLALRYAEWLTGPGVERGLVGPREAERVWERHVINCVAVGALIEAGSSVIDVGSGAGLPGVVLAIARPDLRIVLVESMLRRTMFLEEVVADLDLRSVSVRRARAEDLCKEKPAADVVTARAVAPVDRLATWGVPLLRDGGALLALKGAGVADEMAAGWSALRRLGVTHRAQLFAIIGRDRPPIGGSSSGAQPGVVVAEQGYWEDSATGAIFRPGEEAERVDGEQLALVVRLRRCVKPLSPHPSVGLR